jgi:hypothetical protein
MAVLFALAEACTPESSNDEHGHDHEQGESHEHAHGEDDDHHHGDEDHNDQEEFTVEGDSVNHEHDQGHGDHTHDDGAGHY